MEFVVIVLLIASFIIWSNKDKTTMADKYELWKNEFDAIFDIGRTYKNKNQMVYRYRNIYNEMKGFKGNVLMSPELIEAKLNEHNELILLLTQESRKANSLYKWKYRWTKKRRLQFIVLFEDTYDKTIKYSKSVETIKSIKKFNQLMSKLAQINFEKIENTVTKIREALKVINNSPIEYLSESKANKYRNPNVLSDLQNNLHLYSKYFDLNEIKSFINFQIEFDNFIMMYNKAFIEYELNMNKKFFDDINGYRLDEMQRIAIITDEENNMIISGAGSGKTLTLVGKIKYLMELRGIYSNEILAISFTNKAVDELSERLIKSTGQEIKVATFHKLGREILIKSLGRKIDIDDQELFLSVKKIIGKLSETNKYFSLNLSKYIGLYYYPSINSLDFECQNDLYSDLKSKGAMSINDCIKSNLSNNNLTTYLSERVKSFEELLIANYLFLHGINYEYEKPYEYDTSSLSHRQYKPDFYLSDFNIYLEHFGVDKDMKANHLKNEIERKNYIDGITWKRNIHKKYGTKLIETYSFYHRDGILYEKLDEILKSQGIIVQEYNNERMVKIASELIKSNFISNLAKTITTFIQLFKSNDYDSNYFGYLNNAINMGKSNIYTYRRELLLMAIIETVYDEYCAQLSSRHQYDFNDLINNAIKAVQCDLVKLNYKYIIIDEYQDISMNRYKLLKAIKDKSNCKIIAVGDDWQSIYRFAGSEVSLLHNFETLFGKTEVIKIPNTYRNSQELADVARKFILKNTRQIDKKVVSIKKLNDPIKLIVHSNGCQAEALINVLDNYVANNSKILLLGRTNSCINSIISSGFFELLEEGKVVYKSKPSMKIDFLTVHKSKGLEADLVIILNLNNKINGFPNKIENDPILRFVINDFDEYPFEEERRLFYVALTRSKNEVYLFCEKENESIFVNELIKDKKIEKYDFTNAQDGYEFLNRTCPLCGSESLIKRKSQFGDYLSCKNYPYCDYKISNVQVAIDNIKCSACGDYMVLRNGIYGKFYGCSNYPYCNNKAIYKRKEEVKRPTKVDSYFELEISSKTEIVLERKLTPLVENVQKSEIIQINHNIPTISDNCKKKSTLTNNDNTEKSKKKSDNNLKKESIIKPVVQKKIMNMKKDILSVESIGAKYKYGSEVTHTSFGNGVVIQNDGKIIRVIFDDNSTLSFSYDSVISDNILSIRERNQMKKSDVELLISESDKMFKNNDYSKRAIEINVKVIMSLNQITKTSTKYYLRLAKAYKTIGQFEEAIATYKDILAIDPKNNEALDNLSYLVKLLKTVHENYLDEFNSFSKLNEQFDCQV
ncbi:UvrD-helicase domain-containing protein [Fusibacter bizertensis]|uniref:DNA 3'-5' helicase n=1 Tax=Fusibacter bizertensis TaxID=1488331 RepID=A0ABT6NE71_9FIRM|nr:UvrD-helicase domain-containing protein [Fusibacter bizertensis]MDH8678721.1 UvrD-helicase domain-containing protein [Fusibacter bizertensis]